MTLNVRDWLPLLVCILWMVPASDGDCPEPPSPMHGTISVSGTKVGEIAEMVCNYGYKGSGTSVITCLEDNSWSHPPVVCTLIECAEPVAPEYGSITYSGRHIGATAEQSCDEGYKLSGKAVITCLEDGLWSEPPVTCTKIELNKCRWSNEDCSQNEDCCSGSCVQLHEGTDPRCMPSPMHYPCFYSYQCESGLECGKQYSCCSPFWGICTEQDDCCEQDKYVCRSEEGYIYKSCLKPNGSCRVLFSMQWLTILTSMHILYNFLK